MDNENKSAGTAPNPNKFKDKVNGIIDWIKKFWKEPPKGRYLNLKEILCFGGSAFGVSTLVTVVSGLITATQISELFGIDVIHGQTFTEHADQMGQV